MNASHMTLQRHVLEQQIKTHHVISELTVLFALVSFASKIMAVEMRRAALAGELGLVGSKNVTGDAQKKLDVYANETFIDALSQSGLVAGIVSEENENLNIIACGKSSRYIICMDPFDGSSNTDVNGVAGTIIAIYRKKEGGCENLEEDLIQRHCELVAAIYVMYGPSTIFVYTAGDGVDAFTLEPHIGEFLHSQSHIKCPENGAYFSANTAHKRDWSAPIQKYVEMITYDQAKSGHKPYSLRYAGAMAADLHRNMLEGGIYLYPGDCHHPEGKLRYFYEVAPMAMIMEQAGGRAVTGVKPGERVLDIPLHAIHQTTPVVIGSKAEVDRFEEILAAG